MHSCSVLVQRNKGPQCEKPNTTRGTGFAPHPFRKRIRLEERTFQRHAVDNSGGVIDFVAVRFDWWYRRELDTPVAASRVGRIDSSIDHRSPSGNLSQSNKLKRFPTERRQESQGGSYAIRRRG